MAMIASLPSAEVIAMATNVTSTSGRTRGTLVRMELRHLRAVEAVARHGSFTKAAEELYIAQSAVSQQIGRLERELGIEVFRRSNRSVELTSEGAVVLAHARRVLAEVDELRDGLDELAGLLRGDLRLGGMYPTGLFDLYSVIAEFHGRHPGVAIHFVEGTQDELLAQIRADELDAIFTAVDPATLGNEFAATLLTEEEFVCTLPVDHPLTAQQHVTFEQLAEEDLVTYRENSALRRRLERTMGTRGLVPRNAFICTEMAAVRALVSKGMGIAVIPRSAAEEPGPAIALRPIGPEPFTWPVALVWRAERRQPSAAKAFLALAIASAEQRPAVQLVA
jgi:DNA-binding transcriptional LysR family regulator